MCPTVALDSNMRLLLVCARQHVTPIPVVWPLITLRLFQGVCILTVLMRQFLLEYNTLTFTSNVMHSVSYTFPVSTQAAYRHGPRLACQ